MVIDKNIFKAYDVRGIYPSELSQEAAFAVGRAFIKKTGAKSVVVGHDARISSPALFKALTEGLFAEGAELTSIGQVPTECLYFAVGNYDFDAGIMITASHNPKEYNGFKTMVRNGKNIEWIRGKDLLQFIQEGGFSDNNAKIQEFDVWPDYTKHILTFSGKMNPFNIVIDASSGVIGKAIEKVKSNLPITITELNFAPDGNFPNHSPNPLQAGASNQISEQIKMQKADFGVIFDGDADRIFLVDENGTMVSADITLLLLAKHFLKKNPGMGIAYNLICSRAVPEFVKKWSGAAIRTQVGFVNVREDLAENNGIMGGELSAHYCFRDFWYMDSGMIAFLTLLQIISQDGRPVSQMVKELSIYAPPAQINFQIKDSVAVLEKIKKKYKDGKQDFLDGITVEYSDWWFNARPSNTEPVLKLTIEANTQELLEQKKEELNSFIINSN